MSDILVFLNFTEKMCFELVSNTIGLEANIVSNRQQGGVFLGWFSAFSKVHFC